MVGELSNGYIVQVAGPMVLRQIMMNGQLLLATNATATRANYHGSGNQSSGSMTRTWNSTAEMDLFV